MESTNEWNGRKRKVLEADGKRGEERQKDKPRSAKSRIEGGGMAIRRKAHARAFFL